MDGCSETVVASKMYIFTPILTWMILQVGEMIQLVQIGIYYLTVFSKKHYIAVRVFSSTNPLDQLLVDWILIQYKMYNWGSQLH